MGIPVLTEGYKRADTNSKQEVFIWQRSVIIDIHYTV